MITTTHGTIDERVLERTVGFEDRPTEFVVWVEWRLAAHDVANCLTCRDTSNPQPDQFGRVLVRRDAWVNLKEASVEASAIASAIGG